MVSKLKKFVRGIVKGEALDAELAKLVLNVTGDNRVIEAKRTGTPAEIVVSLNIAALLALLPKTGNNFLFAKLTGQDATNKWWYSWSEAQPTSSGWALKSGGRSGSTTASGGTAADPAMMPDATETFNLSTVAQPYVLLVRAQPDSSGQSGWVIVSPIGFSGSADVPGYVHWDSTLDEFTQDKTTNTWVCGLLVYVGPTGTVLVTDTTACA